MLPDVRNRKSQEVFEMAPLSPLLPGSSHASASRDQESGAFSVTSSRVQSFNNWPVIIGQKRGSSQREGVRATNPLPYLITGAARAYPRSPGRRIRKYRDHAAPFRCYYDRYNVRWLIRFSEPDGRERLMLRARFLMECILGRPLLKHEQVRHRDFDSRNDAPQNLYIFELSDLEPLECERRRRADRIGSVTGDPR